MKKTFCKRFLSVLLATVMVLLTLPAGIFAIAAESEPNAQASVWEAEIYGDGAVVTKYNGTATDVLVPATITVDAVEKKVIKLGNELFANNDAINSVTIAEGITEIGDKTFYDADALVCIVTNQTLTTIGDEAFYGCESLTSVELPDGLQKIGENALTGCADDLTLYGAVGSVAEKYAAQNELRFEPR